MRFTLITLFFVTIVYFSGCKEKDNATPNVETSVPAIVKFTSDKSEIKFGATDPAIITCEATGGSLTYLWEVDLGDIFILNNDGSQVRFTGSECCLGEKFIKCTVSNDKGTVSATIVINIYLP